MTRATFTLMLALAAATLACGALAGPATASTSQVACGLHGLVREPRGPACQAPRTRTTPSAQKNLLGIPVGRVLKKITGTVVGTAIKALGLATIVAWVASGAGTVLRDTAAVIGSTTRPNLQSTWFSASYWRMAAVSALLTLPFLFAAGIHALVRSDLGLLARAAFGYLPLALIAVGIAAPLTTLLLSATDEMSSIVNSASGHADSAFLARAGGAVTSASFVSGDPFIAFFVGMITVGATLALWMELLIRDAAVYVIVLMLPLFFAAMVWPARRAWAVRAIETLIALILSKFAIVAVLALGGAALGHAIVPGPAAFLTGMTLVILATLSPWALLRVLPLHEVAAAAAGGLSHTPRQMVSQGMRMAMGGGAEGSASGSAEAEMGAESADGVDAERGIVARMGAAAQRAGDNRSAGGDADLSGDTAGDGAAPAERSTADQELAAVIGAGMANGSGATGPTATPAASGGATAGDAASDGAAASEAAPKDAAAKGDGDAPARAARLPSMERLYQAQNGAWRPLVINASEDWSRPLIDPEPEPEAVDPPASPPPDATGPDPDPDPAEDGA